MILSEIEIRNIVRDLLIEKIDYNPTSKRITGDPCDELWLNATMLEKGINAGGLKGIKKIKPDFTLTYTDDYKKNAKTLSDGVWPEGHEKEGQELTNKDRVKIKKEQEALKDLARAVGSVYTGLGYTRQQCNDINCANEIDEACTEGELAKGKLQNWMNDSIARTKKKLQTKDAEINTAIHGFFFVFYPRTAKEYSKALKDPAENIAVFSNIIDYDSKNTSGKTPPYDYIQLKELINEIETIDDKKTEAETADAISDFMKTEISDWESAGTDQLSRSTSESENKKARNDLIAALKGGGWIYKRAVGETFTKDAKEITTGGGTTDKRIKDLKKDFSDNYLN